MPLEVKFLEKHPHSAQTFLPTAMKRYLVLVCPKAANGDPSLGALNAFVADDSSEALGIYCRLLKEYLTTHAGREAVAHTYVTVSALALPGVLIEIEGVAIRET